MPGLKPKTSDKQLIDVTRISSLSDRNLTLSLVLRMPGETKPY